VEKTKIVILSKSKVRTDYNFTYQNEKVDAVEEFKYLGVLFNYNGSFVKFKKYLYDYSHNAMFALIRKCRQHTLPIDIQLDLFGRLVVPILLYGCEIWGFENVAIIEKLQLKFLKYVLGVRPSTSTCMVLGKTGSFPLHISIKMRMMSYWVRLVNTPEIRLNATM
jgi:hypothetical protein